MEEDIPCKEEDWSHLHHIRETTIYKKLVRDEEESLKEIMETQKKIISANSDRDIIKVQGYKDTLKKNKLLMGLTEDILLKLNPSLNRNKSSSKNSNENFRSYGSMNKNPINDFLKSGDKKKKATNLSKGGSSDEAKKNEEKSRKIGFMFFNSNVFISPSSATCGSFQKDNIMLTDSNDGFYQQSSKNMKEFEQRSINFQVFEDLYQAGKEHGSKYTTKITDFDFSSSIDLRTMCQQTHGQTALGPAIVTALGVVSQHGPGSSILVVTDGIGNKGIFDQINNWEQQYKLLKIRLERLKCFMTVLEFRNLMKDEEENLSKQKEKQTSLDAFCSRYKDHIVRKINVILKSSEGSSDHTFKQKMKSNLNDIETKLKVGIKRQSTIWSNDVLIQCQNCNMKYDLATTNLKRRLFNQEKETIYLTPQYDHNKLQKEDYLQHFMTQILIKYENLETGEQCVFMSYVLQKFIRLDQMKEKDLKVVDNEKTLFDVMEFLEAEEKELNLENIPMGLLQRTFRQTISMRGGLGQKTFRFPSKDSQQITKGDLQLQRIQQRKKKKMEQEQEVKEWMQFLRQAEQKAKKQQKDSLKKKDEKSYLKKQSSPVNQIQPISGLDSYKFSKQCMIADVQGRKEIIQEVNSNSDSSDEEYIKL